MSTSATGGFISQNHLTTFGKLRHIARKMHNLRTKENKQAALGTECLSERGVVDLHFMHVSRESCLAVVGGKGVKGGALDGRRTDMVLNLESGDCHGRDFNVATSQSGVIPPFNLPQEIGLYYKHGATAVPTLPNSSDPVFMPFYWVFDFLMNPLESESIDRSLLERELRGFPQMVSHPLEHTFNVEFLKEEVDPALICDALFAFREGLGMDYSPDLG